MSPRHSKLRIGIVGAGSVVKNRHLPALKKIPDVEVAAVCNSTYESSEKFCVDYVPEATPYGNWAELVADPEIDIVWIGTPPYLHATIAVSALEAGKICRAKEEGFSSLKMISHPETQVVFMGVYSIAASIKNMIVVQAHAEVLIGH